MQWLGTAGIQIFSRVAGLVLTSIAVNGIVTAIKISFGLAS
jgi:small neutral amino acid transporter SnatA (MarC family)